MSEPILIFGVTGRVGGELFRQLRTINNIKAIGAVRNLSKAKLLPELKNADLIEADLSNPSSINKAITTTNAKKVFLYAAQGNVSPGMSDTINALKSNGISHVVFLSSWTVLKPEYIEIKDAITMNHYLIEENIKKSGMIYTFIRGGYFASNALHFWAKEINTGAIHVHNIDIKHTCIAEEDMASLATVALTSNRLNNQAVSAVGAEKLSARQQIEIISKIINKPLKIIPITEQQFHENVKFLPVPFQDSLYRIGTDPDENKEGNGDLQRNILGRSPMTFEEYVTKHIEELESNSH